MVLMNSLVSSLKAKCNLESQTTPDTCRRVSFTIAFKGD